MAVNPVSSSAPRIVAVGCGPWGLNIIRNLAELGALAGLVRRRGAEEVARVRGVPLVSFEDALADPEIQGVAIATPPVHHPKLAARALAAGKHVYVEKTVAISSQDVRDLCALARQSDRRLMVGHVLQYHPAFLKVLEIVRSGELGRILSVQASRMNLGRVRREEEDVAWSLGPHDVSMLHALIEGEPRVVSAVAGYHLRPDVADIVHAHLEFPQGIAAHLTLSWYHPLKEQRLVVIGAEGMVVFDDAQHWEHKLVVYRHRAEWRDGLPEALRAPPEPVQVEPAEPLRQELRHFLSCIETGAAPRTDGVEALRVVRTIEQIRSAMVACGSYAGATAG
jgi:UDP-2-acetamido-3-amino-2,3-dideoxy-glucuronate N-acetyltransferase